MTQGSAESIRARGMQEDSDCYRNPIAQAFPVKSPKAHTTSRECECNSCTFRHELALRTRKPNSSYVNMYPLRAAAVVKSDDAAPPPAHASRPRGAHMRCT